MKALFCIIFCLVALSTHASVTIEQVDGLLIGKTTVDERESVAKSKERIINAVKRRVLLAQPEFFVRATKLVDETVHEDILTRIVMANINLTVLDENLSALQGVVGLSVTLQAQVDEIEIGNYVDAYFKNLALKQQIDELAQVQAGIQTKINEITKLSRDNEALVDEHVGNEAQLSQMISALKSEESMRLALAESAARQERLSLVLPRLVEQALDSADIAINQTEIVSYRENKTHHGTAKVDIKIDWQKVLDAMPSSVKVRRCRSYFGGEYLQFERSFTKTPPAVIKAFEGIHQIEFAGDSRGLLVAGTSSACGKPSRYGPNISMLISYQGSWSVSATSEQLLEMPSGRLMTIAD